MHMKKAFGLLFLITVILLGAIVYCALVCEKQVYYLELSGPGELFFYDRKHDIRFPGKEMDGVTYFFLPSYINTESIIQSSETNRIFISNGHILDNARYGEIQDIYVDYGDGTRIPWKICFMRSANLYSAFIFLDSKTYWDIDRSAYSDASIAIYDPVGDKEYIDKSILIKGRGNSSWQAKRPFEIKTSYDVPLCGLKPSDKWVLLSNYLDPTLMMNHLMFELSDKMGIENTTDSEWMDLYINNEYVGNYLICKEPQDGFSSGFLIKKDLYDSYEKHTERFSINENDNSGFILVFPRNSDADLLNDIKGYITIVDERIKQECFDTELLDIPSFAKRYLLEEFIYNTDSMARSYYFYGNDFDGKLHAGPCWDYDQAGGFDTSEDYFLDYDYSVVEASVNEWGAENVLCWDALLLSDPLYREEVCRIYSEYYPFFEEAVFETIPEYQCLLEQSAAMDYMIWKDSRKKYETYQDNVRYLRFFLHHRLRYLSEMLSADVNVPELNLSNNQRHTVSFIFPGRENENITVNDGDEIRESLLPQYDPKLYYWENLDRNYVYYSPFVPIYEDTRYILETADQ